jgi:uncharacterized protein (DUF58 family)
LLTLDDLIQLRLPSRHLDLLTRPSISSDVGNHATRYRGQGMHFAEVRAYQSGDDIRHMDWRVTARTGKPHTKVYEEERQPSIGLVIDLRASMYFATRGCLKSVLASRIAAMLAWTAHWQHLSLGALLVLPKTIQWVPMHKRAQNIFSLLKKLTEVDQSTSFYMHNAVDDAMIFSHITQCVPRGAQVLWISDFAHFSLENAARLSAWKQHYHFNLLWVHDPIEITMLPEGTYTFSNAHRTLTLLLENGSVRQAYAQQIKQRSQLLEQLQRQVQIPLCHFSTSDHDLAAMKRYFFKSLKKCITKGI